MKTHEYTVKKGTQPNNEAVIKNANSFSGMHSSHFFGILPLYLLS